MKEQKQERMKLFMHILFYVENLAQRELTDEELKILRNNVGAYTKKKWKHNEANQAKHIDELNKRISNLKKEI